VIIASSLLDD